MQILGDTLGKIAAEKAGIIKKHCHCVTSSAQPEEAIFVIRDAVSSKHAYLFEADERDLFEVISSDLSGSEVKYRNTQLHIPFPGAHQLQNAAIAIKACEVIGVSGFDITVKHIRDGLAASFIPARIEVMRLSPIVILDGSHNQDSLKALADLVKTTMAGKRILAVMGMMADKDCVNTVRQISDIFSEVITVTPSNPRAMDAKSFADLLTQQGISAHPASAPEDGIDREFEKIKDFDALIVCGSLYLAADVREYMIQKLSDLDEGGY